MSKHSKWAKIKRQKEAEDVKRGAIFSKLARAITLAAQEGEDPATNFKLRLAIDEARSFNMPKENIERAIAKGSGKLSGEAKVEEIRYEAFLPGGVALVIDAITENRNRTGSEIKHLLSEYGGSLGAPNSVLWMFDQKGVIKIRNFFQSKSDDEIKKEKEKIIFLAIETGAEDVGEDDELTIYTKPVDLKKVKDELTKQGIGVDYVGFELIAKNKIEIKDQTLKEKLENFFNELDEMDDVNNYFTNLSDI
jgi:YebC/PmpR family DNA-binding regulatory protein